MPTDQNQLPAGTEVPTGPILFGRPTAAFDSPDLVGQVMAELLDPAAAREQGRQGAGPAANVMRRLPATEPAQRYTAARARGIRAFRLDCNAGLAKQLIDCRGNFVHYRRSETGPAGVTVYFDDAGNDGVWLPAGGWISGAVFDRLFVDSAAAAGGFATLAVSDDPRADQLRVGSTAV